MGKRRWVIGSEVSAADLVFKLSNFLLSMHYSLLHDWLLFFEFDDLLLHVFVFPALFVNLLGKVFKVWHYVGVNDLYVLVVLGGQVVLHEPNFLTQQFYLFFVLSQSLLSLHNNVLKKEKNCSEMRNVHRPMQTYFNSFDWTFHIFVLRDVQLNWLSHWSHPCSLNNIQIGQSTDHEHHISLHLLPSLVKRLTWVCVLTDIILINY